LDRDFIVFRDVDEAFVGDLVLLLVEVEPVLLGDSMNIFSMFKLRQSSKLSSRFAEVFEEKDVLFESLAAFSLFEHAESLEDNSEHSDDSDEFVPPPPCLAIISVNPESVRTLVSSLSEISFNFSTCSTTLESNEIGEDEVDDDKLSEDKLDDDEVVDKRLDGSFCSDLDSCMCELTFCMSLFPISLSLTFFG